MTQKKHSASSKRWLQEHFNDKYVQQAQKKGLRSRAVFKLDEIDEKERIIRPGMAILDLGAAPGGWSQYCAEKLAGNGRVIASDILPMDPIAGVDFLPGDFQSDDVLALLLERIDGRNLDLILSDMAPNMTGNTTADQAKSIYLCELALDMCHTTLKPGGNFVIKVFQGEGFDAFHKAIKFKFTTVKSRKPSSSRSRSREVFIVAKGFKLS